MIDKPSRTRRIVTGSLAWVCLLVGGTRRLEAQRRDSTKVRTDSVSTPVPVSPLVTSPTQRGRFTPPLTPRRAFLYSLALPGLGQARLDRGISGALFASIELAALTMVQRTRANVREAQVFRSDSLPAEFTVGPDGVRQPTGTVPARFEPDLLLARRLHVEDWLAVIAFNHLFGAADAFVAAQLWDVPVRLSAYPQRSGAALVVSVRF